MTEQLKPCPFCGGGTTEITENGRVWTGMKWGEPSSVSVRHWCEEVPGQPSRMLERVGRDHEAAIAAWNCRAQPAQAGAEPVDVVRQFRKMRCADWYDGLPDHEDGGGPYETRTLYHHPPAREPLTEQEIWDAVQHGVVGGIGMPSKAIAVARAIEAAHGIGGGK